MTGPQVSWLPDGRRLHMNHGPIDLIVEAFGAQDECLAAYRQAAARFETILVELVAELPALRAPAAPRPRRLAGSTAQRMERAAAAFAADFITPMAAVAGAVAEEILSALTAGRELSRAYVNDGGDIALYLGAGQTIRLAIAGTGNGFADRVRIAHADPVRGVATSGWRGRSHCLGIADAVTVLARSAAMADAAATLLANAVDLPGHQAIRRRPALELAPDSDLGDRPVTVAVGFLDATESAAALEPGLTLADRMRECGHIEAAALFLNGQCRISGTVDLLAATTRSPKEAAHA